MIKIEHTELYGWEAAVRGLRNPLESWEKSDSEFYYIDCYSCPHKLSDTSCDLWGCVVLGENDLKLMKSLSKAGTDHSKYLRFITVTADITAPLYWWKEYDTYKVATVANSCSTMHKIHAKEFTIDDFSHEHLITDEDTQTNYVGVLDFVIDELNRARMKYLETKDKKYWWQMIQLLPSSYNQKRTVLLNYQVLKNMYHARKNHKLDEWHDFCHWCESLPYFNEICVEV